MQIEWVVVSNDDLFKKCLFDSTDIQKEQQGVE